VKEQTSAYLEKSRDLLGRADTMMGAGLTDDAGRMAHLVGLDAAQAFIFETTGRVFKTHSGVQREFSRVVKTIRALTPACGCSFSRTYQLKAIADYLTGPGSTVTVEQAQEAIQQARRFVASVESLIPANGQTPSAPEAPKP
jgi:uncharacterized protein (UPF0332 family)